MGAGLDPVQRVRKVKKQFFSRMVLESPTIAGDSPVGEKKLSFSTGFPSTAGHVKSRWNLGRPLSKAKYSLVTDSEPVP
jgi:hypothetical protein